MRSNGNNFLPSSILAFLFGGCIIGETVSMSLVVSHVGAQAVGNLYIVNGVLLFSLPFVFFRLIDKVNRGKLLSYILFSSSLILWFTAFLLFFFKINIFGSINSILLLLYPFSYLSKTILFLTFWTLANDIYKTDEAKKSFPRIAAWGFIGALAGACVARFLLIAVDVEAVITLWASLFLIAWFCTRKVNSTYAEELNSQESLHQERHNFIRVFQDVIKIKLVRLIAIFYFFIFLAVFCFDFLFWKQCEYWFATPKQLTSFQFTFYLVHGLFTIIGLWVVLPRLISKLGFSRLLYALPTVLGGCATIFLFTFFMRHNIPFYLFVIAQFLRYVVFENAFSPIYQMFFAAVEKQHRGRAKTVLEGFIKPASIISSGTLLSILSSKPDLILLVIICSSIILIFTVVYIRKTYSHSILQQSGPLLSIENLLDKDSNDDKKIVAILETYLKSSEVDLRILAVRLLSSLKTQSSLDLITKSIRLETNDNVRELLAKALSGFSLTEIKPILNFFLNDTNPRIRANALQSLNQIESPQKKSLRPLVRSLMQDSSIRVQIQAAYFFWMNGDLHEKNEIKSFVSRLLKSEDVDTCSAGIFLIGLTKMDGWEKTLLSSLPHPSLKIFSKSLEILFRFGSHQSHLEAFRIIDNMERERISELSKILAKLQTETFHSLSNFLPLSMNKRMFYELIKNLRLTIGQLNAKDESWVFSGTLDKTIRTWINDELRAIYRDAYMRAGLKINDEEIDTNVLDIALRENSERICLWIIDALAILDHDHTFLGFHLDQYSIDEQQRMDLIEILENSSMRDISKMIIPILNRSSWDELANKCKSFFGDSEYNADENGLLYFAKSHNRWIVMGALHAIAFHERSLEFVNLDRTLFMRLSKEPIQKIASAARTLLDGVQGNLKEIDTFAILERILFLKGTKFFHNVNAEKLLKLAEICQSRFFSKGTIISAQGEISDHLYLVKSGSVKVLRNDDELETLLTIIGPNESYGEIGLFNQAPRSASAIANEDCELIILRRSNLKKLLVEVPEIGQNLLEVFSEKLKKNGDELAYLNRKIAYSTGSPYQY